MSVNPRGLVARGEARGGGNCPAKYRRTERFLVENISIYERGGLQFRVSRNRWMSFLLSVSVRLNLRVS